MQLRTTVRLEESLLAQARNLAARQNTTLTSLIEEGLHKVIKEARTSKSRRKIPIPISKQTGGTWITDNRDYARFPGLRWRSLRGNAVW
jgi:hypothetical protein